jgi:DNA-binding winged helix-turn-helix (wHTH) protein
MFMKNNQRYEFGPYRVDANERVLWQGDEIVRLTPKIVETLLVLVESEGKVVTKEELMSRIWPDTIVDEANLTQNIFVLRKCLRNANGCCRIETISKTRISLRRRCAYCREYSGREWFAKT